MVAAHSGLKARQSFVDCRAFFRASYIQKRRAADLAVAAELSGAADGLRSTRAAEYGRDIDERYGATGLWKLGGDVAAGAGQMAPTVAVNLLTGGRLGTPFLLSSAAGNAAAEARAGGADEETAFLYGILSGGVEAATERISAGIPGLNKTGLLDDVLSRVASSPTGRGAVKKLVDVLGEGAEEYISEIAGAYLAKLWNGDERGAWQTFVETQPDALYAGLVGTLTSAVMNLPGEAYALARKNKPGAVPDAQQSGNSVPRLFTRDEVQGMSAREVSENYDAIRESMEMWDENGELQGGTQSRMVDRQAPGTDNSGSSTAGEAWHAAQNTEQFSGGAIDGGQGISEKSGWNSKDGGAVYRGEGQSSNARRIRRIAQENAEQFQRSARERGKQQIERHGGASYAYTIAKQPEGAAKQIADGLSARGIEAIVIDAPLETNQNGVTVERGDAVTGPDGRVYIYNGTALNPDSVLAHESVHAAVRKNKPEAHDFVSAIDQATDKSSYYYLACAQIINEAHYDGQLDLTTQEGQAAVRDEMAAYWAGAYNSKNAEELELLSCIDAQQAFTAWNAFNTFENIDAAAGKTKTGDISATTDIQNGSVPTLKAPSHTISPVSNSRIAQTGENATGFSGPAAERTSDVSAVPPALNPAPRLYTRAEVQGMSAGEVRENYDAIQESMRLWDKNGELLQSAETETARRMALETGRAGKTDLDWLEHLAGTAKMELQYVFQPGSGVQAAVQGRRITVNLGGAGYAFGAAVHELGHSMKAADAKAYAKFESAVLRLAQSDAALEQIARQTAADYLSPDSPARAGLLDTQGNIDAAALNEEISLRLAQELVADPEKLVRAVERDRGLMETFLDFVRGLKNRIAIRLSGSERAMLDEAERTLVNLLRGEAGSVAGEKYSFVRATDAEQIARAQELEAQGENAKTIWSETHLTRDGGGAWVREISDRGAKLYPNGNARGEKGGRLADYLEHPELYEADPGIADINVELGTLSESEKGKYSLQERTLRFTEDTFKNKSMSDIMHEVQHAIQNEEELAAGGSRKLAYAALVSDAYEAVKDTPEFQSLQTKEERLHYLEEAAAKQAGAPDIETAATNGYVNLGGEKMARQTAKRWYYTKDQREKTWPDVAGNVLDKSVESQRIVETLERIGYTEDEIEAFIKNWGGQK